MNYELFDKGFVTFTMKREGLHLNIIIYNGLLETFILSRYKYKGNNNWEV